MKIVNVIGGLGNQMFQCAFAIALKSFHPEEDVKLDTSHFNGYGLHNGFEVTEIFNYYPIGIATKRECKRLTTYIPKYKWSRLFRLIFPKKKTEYLQPYQYSYIFDPSTLNVQGDSYWEGYWMSAKYFERCKDEVIKAFEFKPIDTEENQRYANLLAQNNSISIHIRRGDYVTAKNFKGICTLDYYRKAIEEAKKIIQNPSYYIFSNDPEWCMNNMNDMFGDAEVHFVTNNKGKESYRDMQLMSMARCNILANSSFSWWGAFLSKRKDKIVYVPSKWVNNLNDRDAYSDNWIKIQI